MFGFSFPSLLLLVAVALLVLGPKQTVSLFVKAGDFINNAKRQYIKLKNELNFIDASNDNVCSFNDTKNDCSTETNSVFTSKVQPLGSEISKTLSSFDNTQVNSSSITKDVDFLKRIDAIELELKDLKAQLKEKDI